ncbi:adenosylcobinamide-phosphate synthase CbiB [Aquisalimonas asiatica]|uniref:Cobalamin biosynthesis protein CobD n=1 Tax=Aquisalimonas asiatica TaxID=406100 RepID=A0A1H8UEP3_9GAMM|nr:adenosylcobinamide-phosphate synthase CbiB [Aquisalimonas asiatica]SEP01700.1 adenosylcobinamide-phosphate synthase [Aquisalimonas asiatica]
MLTALVCIGAVILDTLLGEPRRLHPLVLFGALADAVERRFNPDGHGSIASGLTAAAVLLAPPVLVAVVLALVLPPVVLVALEIVVLYLAIGPRSLGDHARAVATPLIHGDLAGARDAVGAMVSRDTRALDQRGVAGAASESVLENGADAVFASLFWYLVAGLPGVILHRLVNTLDAMWGYRTPRYLLFGRVVARLDDALNWIPARLTALAYAASGRTATALSCWFRQAGAWESPNAGPVMAAGAGALGVTLGGAAPYRDGWRERPPLGEGPPPDGATIDAAVVLVRRAVFCWLAVILLGGMAWSLITAAG